MIIFKYILAVLQALWFKMASTDNKVLDVVITTPEPPKPPSTEPITPNSMPTIIERWAAAIGHWEGANPVLNNPGNLKYSTLTASWGGTRGPRASDGGFLCKFPTKELGNTALVNFLTLGCQNQLLAFHKARTLHDFTVVYAGNPPQGYINGIVKMLGVSPTVLISTFL